jgi:cell division initiation protein
MDKFKKTLRGYNPKEVNAFLDEVIGQFEKMVTDLKEKDKELFAVQQKVNALEEQVNRYKMIENTLNRTIVAAQDSGEQIRRIAKQESEMIINEARRNSNRIVNDALVRAERAEFEASVIRKNILLYKNKIRGIIESQLEIIDEIGNDNI